MKRKAGNTIAALALAAAMAAALPAATFAEEAAPYAATAETAALPTLHSAAQPEPVMEQEVYDAGKRIVYIDENGDRKQARATVLTGSEGTLTTGWYVAESNVSYGGRLIISGDVKLILVANLTADSGGVNVNEGNSLTIYSGASRSGTLSAEGSINSAGIGGSECAGGSITINGGNITATGGLSGAGIGGGKVGAGGIITINGGTVTAKANGKSAGIGGGAGGDGGSITISGGTVRASGDKSGAGIGGGAGGDGGSITISGGTVTATGEGNAAGIGSGANGHDSTITISGGIVTATGGENATGIGCGITDSTDIEDTGTFSTGDTGTAYIKTNGISDTSRKDAWYGIIEIGSEIIVRGSQTLPTSTLEIPEGTTLTIEKGSSLTVPQGAGIINSGAIAVEGSLINNGTIEGGGTVANFGTIENNGTITGNIVNSATGALIGSVKIVDADQAIEMPADGLDIGEGGIAADRLVTGYTLVTQYGQAQKVYILTDGTKLNTHGVATSDSFISAYDDVPVNIVFGETTLIAAESAPVQINTSGQAEFEFVKRFKIEAPDLHEMMHLRMLEFGSSLLGIKLSGRGGIYAEYPDGVEYTDACLISAGGSTNISIDTSITAENLQGAIMNTGGEVSITGGVLRANASTFSGAASADGIMASKVAISGGTLSMSTLSSSIAAREMIVTGGSLDLSKLVKTDAVAAAADAAGDMATFAADGGALRPVNGEGTPVYKTTVALAAASADTAIAELSGAGSYGIKDMITDSGSKLYLWLPQGAHTLTITDANGIKYTGTVVTAEDDTASAQLDAVVTAPLDLTALVAAPVKGAAPQASFAGQAQYTGTISWGENTPAAFAPGTAYTATLALTPKDGYTFAGMAADAFSYSGAAVTTAAAADGTAVVSITFPETALREVTGFAISGQPDKTVYDIGEGFDPSGLTMTIAYDDGSTTVLDKATGYTGISIEPAVMAAGTTQVNISYGGKTATVTGLTVRTPAAPATATPVPTALATATPVPTAQATATPAPATPAADTATPAPEAQTGGSTATPAPTAVTTIPATADSANPTALLSLAAISALCLALLIKRKYTR